ncbi:MAG: hypothetical protein WA317_15320 [Mycobacterium sp.]|uniref:hypothetical protein n=1 Tax=Mycobacterium sp. TaxID=1785 RepID=UPI003CC6CFC6
MRHVTWLCASVVVLGAGPLVSCSVPLTYSAPATFTVSNESVSEAIEQVMTLNSMVKIDGKPDVECAGETRCSIAYAIEQSLGGSSNWEDNELIRPTRHIWQTLFADPKFQSGTITVSGPQISNASAMQPYYTLSCDRRQTAHVDWSDIDGWGLRRSCDYSPLIGGMPGT